MLRPKAIFAFNDGCARSAACVGDQYGCLLLTAGVVPAAYDLVVVRFRHAASRAVASTLLFVGPPFGWLVLVNASPTCDPGLLSLRHDRFGAGCHRAGTKCCCASPRYQGACCFV